MAERINRREQLIDVAERLFVDQGYTATSVRQITDEVGCTEAALYYHFKDGKRELLQEVINCHTPHLDEVMRACQSATSLTEMIHIYQKTFRKSGRVTMTKARWLLSEFHRLSPEEQAIIKSKWTSLQGALSAVIAHFVDDPVRAERLAWLIVISTIGYGMLFFNFGLESQVDFSADDLAEVFIELLSGDL